MSQAEALLNRVAGNSTYTATPETEPHIVIGADRFITVPDELKRLGVQGDKDIETVTFDCPRYWDDTDMSEMSVAINIQRKDGVSDKYLADNVVVDIADQSMMHFDWTISKFVAEVKGALRFNVCISSVDESGKEVEHWNSEVCEDCYISEGLETDKQIVEAYPDVITQLRTTMENLLNSGMAVDVNVQKVGRELIVNVSGPEGSETFRLYDGVDGKTPFIGNNGHWWIGEEDTGVTAAASTAGMMPVSVYDPQGKQTDIFKYVEDNGVSAADRAKWDAKSNFSGSYNDLTDKPSMPSAVIVTTGSKSIPDINSRGTLTLKWVKYGPVVSLYWTYAVTSWTTSAYMFKLDSSIPLPHSLIPYPVSIATVKHGEAFMLIEAMLDVAGYMTLTAVNSYIGGVTSASGSLVYISAE